MMTGDGSRDSEAVEFFASIGFWWNEDWMSQVLDAPSAVLRSQAEENLLLGVEFADGKLYFPAWQVADGVLLPGLEEVLAVLATAFRAPETRAAWLAGRAYTEGDARRIDVLRSGALDLVVAWAAEDAARIQRP